MIDLTHELTAWLRSTDARTLMKEIVAEAVQSEIRSALEDELVDVEGAAAMLDMTEGRCERPWSADKSHVSASATGFAFGVWTFLAERNAADVPNRSLGRPWSARDLTAGDRV